MNIVIVGHIDHGKSTLIGRILFDTKSIPQSVIDDVTASNKGVLEFAYLLDCLEEERAKNITIDTTQTFFATPKRRYTIIDAPGHREFLRNMVSGASLANAAVLMLDVSRGMEEQTRRHANILRLLGLKEVIVAVNKLDAVAYQEDPFRNAEKEVREFFAKVGLTPHAIIPIAAKCGDNIASRSAAMSWYSGPSLLETLDLLPEPATLEGQPLRFPIQDVYEVNAEKIVVGRVESGTLRVGQEVALYPGGTKATLTSIQVMEGKKESAEPQECVGITLSSMEGVERGAVLCDHKVPAVKKSLETIIFAMTDKPLDANSTYTFECATQSVPCRISNIKRLINSSTLEVAGAADGRIASTHAAEVDITLESPTVLEPFASVPGLGRFILSKNDEIQGAGIVHA